MTTYLGVAKFEMHVTCLLQEPLL